MSVDVDLFSKGGVESADQSEKARRAVKAFRSMQPILTAYAKVLTKRRDVRVEMAARDNGSTDGKRIFFRPPIALGDNTPHVRKLCDRRDERLQPRCPACLVREEVLVTILHEIAHIAYDSFDQTTEEERRQMIEAAVKESPRRYADRVRERLEALPDWQTNSYIGLAGKINQYLPIIVNALEDARVNRETFKARKGTKVMFDSDTWRTFTKGVEQKDASGQVITKMWTEYPLNAQVIVGLFCKASGYDYSDWFVPPVVQALNDPELTAILNQMDTVRSAQGVYHLSFPVLARLRELGFCGTPEDPDPEPEESPSSEQSDESEEQEKSDEEDASTESSEDSSDDSGDSRSDSSDQESPEDREDSDGGDSSGAKAEDGSADEGGESSDSSDGDSSTDEGESDDDMASSEVAGGQAASGEDTEDEGSAGSGSDSDSSEASEEGQVDEGSDADGADQAASEGGELDDSDGGEASTGERSGNLDESSTDESDAGTDPDQAAEADAPAPGELSEGDESDEAVDTGADDGTGGTELIEKEEFDHLGMGDPEEVSDVLATWGHHEEKPKSMEEQREEKAVDKAIVQGIYFETPSRNIWGVREHRHDNPTVVDGYIMSTAWDHTAYTSVGLNKKQLGIVGDFSTPESILGPALMRMRIAFADNQRGKENRHKKGGRVDGRVLGKRAALGDERLFKTRTLPGKKNYFVLIGMDVSGSTLGKNIELEKKAVMAQATLLNRMGIRFAIYAHSGNMHAPASGRADGLDLDIYFVKEPNEVWDTKVQERLQDIGPDSYNLDGHTLEYYRKVLDNVDATDKIILYYTDGKMPAENYAEELEILQREIAICRQKNYTLLGVGIRTDSPVRHGLDTVQVDGDEDIVKVVKHIEKRLLVA